MALSARALLLFMAAGVSVRAEDTAGLSNFLEKAPGRKLQTENATATTPQPQAYDDVIMAECTPGANCSENGMPIERGICVQNGAGQECWDVCNPIHTPQEYIVGRNMAQNSGYAGLVAQVRAGLNSYVQCPGALAQGDTCPPGRPCSYNMRKQYKIPKGRGMCVVDPSKPNSRACWDMCDLSHEEQDYNLGTSEGAAARVSGVRNGGGCPSAPWWPWVLVAVVIVAILSCCVAFVVSQRMNRKNRSRGLDRPSSRFDQQQDFKQEFNYPPDQDYVNHDRQDFLEPISEPVVEDRGPPDMPSVQDYGQVVAPQMPEEELLRDRLPPEPPQAGGSMREFEMQQPFVVQDESHFQGSGSMRIPGLDEPNLFSASMQGLVVPQGQVGAPDYLTQVQSQSQPFLIPGNSQPQVQAPFRVASSGQGVPTFTTMPPMGMQPMNLGQTVSAPTPPASVQIRPPAQLFTTQLVRR